MNNKICNSIFKRQVVEFFYDGKLRRVEPYCHGTSTAGNEVLRGFQVSGESISGDIPDWRLFEVLNIRNLRVTDENFDGSRSGYNPKDKQMTRVHCRI